MVFARLASLARQFEIMADTRVSQEFKFSEAVRQRLGHGWEVQDMVDCSSEQPLDARHFNLGQLLIWGIEQQLLGRPATNNEEIQIHLYVTEMLDVVAVHLQPRCRITIAEFCYFVGVAWNENYRPTGAEPYDEAQALMNNRTSARICQLRQDGALIEREDQARRDEREARYWHHLQWLARPPSERNSD